MKLRAFLVFGAGLWVATLLSGCATQTAMGKHNASFLGGLAEYRGGAYEPASPTSLPVNSDSPTRLSRMTGTHISLLWGLITYSDQ